MKVLSPLLQTAAPSSRSCVASFCAWRSRHRRRRSSGAWASAHCWGSSDLLGTRPTATRSSGRWVRCTTCARTTRRTARRRSRAAPWGSYGCVGLRGGSEGRERTPAPSPPLVSSGRRDPPARHAGGRVRRHGRRCDGEADQAAGAPAASCSGGQGGAPPPPPPPRYRQAGRARRCCSDWRRPGPCLTASAGRERLIA